MFLKTIQRHSGFLGVLTLCAFATGILFRYAFDAPDERHLLNYLRSGFHAVGLAFAGWAAHLGFEATLQERLRRVPLLIELGARTVLMALVLTAIALVLQVALYGATIEQHWIRANLPLIVAVALALSTSFGAFFELTRLVGGRVLLSFVLGTYHRPKAENRIIMFLDLAGSTALAERLGEIRLQELITRVFLDIDEAIVTYQGEIHAYVGDGVIVTWPFRDKLQNGAVVHCFFAIQETLAKHAPLYQDRFGVVPRFRASLHAGPVVISECGNSKRQIALFGDAMNVAARLQDYCKSKQSDLVVSGPLLANLQLPWEAEVEAQETVLLRGRETPVEASAVRRSPHKL